MDARLAVGFKDRIDAGRALAEQLASYAHRPGTLILALPRGGVPVASEVADALRLPWDVLVVRKLGLPGHEELAMGAVASGGSVVADENLIGRLGITRDAFQTVLDRERIELERRERLYRDGRPAPQVRGRTVIVIDDGLATGATMLSAVTALRRLGAAKVIVAAPVASAEACDELDRVADECVCVICPRPFESVGRWYWSFEQVIDDQVRAALAGHTRVKSRANERAAS